MNNKALNKAHFYSINKALLMNFNNKAHNKAHFYSIFYSIFNRVGGRCNNQGGLAVEYKSVLLHLIGYKDWISYVYKYY